MTDATTAGTAQAASSPGSRSPISQLLVTLGMTRDDLTRHSAQMREFLTTETSNTPRPLLPSTANARPSSQNVQTKQSIKSSQPTDATSSKRGQPNQFPSHPHNALTPPPSQNAPKEASIPKSIARTNGTSMTSRETVASRRGEPRRERRHPPQATSPTRQKPNLDEIMQMRSRESRCTPEHEDSDSSDEGPYYDLYRARQKTTPVSPHHHQPYYLRQSATNRASSSSVEPQSASKYYRQESPVVSGPGGNNYYRNHDGSAKTPITPTSTSNTRQRRTPNVTPTKQRTLLQPSSMSQRLNATSSPVPSSPISSSARYPVNIASSPGPLASSPAKPSDPELPFTLPPGPYSEEKPELSYAALIGRAILASPEHRLRLKDIYDYISIVFPYFKRDGHSHGQKWMNAIRQNLTNTPQFHKSATVDPATKSSYWCIKDNDLPCFANGGYNRHALNPYGVALPSARADKRKRKEEEGNNAKKSRILPPMAQPQPPNPYHFPYGYPQMPMHFPIAGRPIYIDQSRTRADMVFPPLPATHPHAHMVHRVPQENEHVIFPPLPASSQTRIAREARLKAQAQLESEAATEVEEEAEVEDDAESDANRESVTPPPLTSSEASTTCLPELTSNDSSSSPPNDTPTLDGSVELEVHIGVATVTRDEDDLMDMIFEVPADADQRIAAADKGKARAIVPENEEDEFELMYPPLPTMPTTPTTRRRSTQTRTASASRAELSLGEPPSEPSDHIRPTTPPPKTSTLLSAVSLVRTPASSKGHPSTPMRGSVRFELLDEDNEERNVWNDTLPRTPARGKSATGSSANPITPKKIFSPYPGFSPFRTPSRRLLLDPSDPSALLDDELSALASASYRQGPQESPVGFFGHGKGLLYESPNIPSPSRWRPW